MEAGRTAVDGVYRELPAVNNDRGDGGPPVLAAGQSRIVRRRSAGRVVNQLLAGNDSRPAALHEAAVPLADAGGGRSAIGDVGDPDCHVAVEDAIERLILVTSEIRVWRVVHSAAQNPDVTAHGRIRDDG